MPELSPQAQAVLDAYNAGFARPVAVHHKPRLAAALRAAADQVVPEEELPVHARGTSYWHKAIQRSETRDAFLAIAAELRGTTTTTQEDN